MSENQKKSTIELSSDPRYSDMAKGPAQVVEIKKKLFDLAQEYSDLSFLVIIDASDIDGSQHLAGTLCPACTVVDLLMAQMMGKAGHTCNTEPIDRSEKIVDAIEQRMNQILKAAQNTPRKKDCLDRD